MISDLGKKNKKETQTQEQTQNQNETQNQGAQEQQGQQNQEQNQQSGEQNQQSGEQNQQSGEQNQQQQQGQQTEEQNQQEQQGQEQQGQQNEGQGQQEQQTQPEITYQILHYKQNILDDEYTLFETETITAQTGTQTTAKAKPYYGFTSKDFSQASVASDSSTQISIYYDRKEFTITLNLNGGSFPHDQNCPLTITAKYETQLDIPSPEKSNYIFCGWNKIGGEIPETMTKDGTYKACWIKDSETPQYIVSYSTEYGTAPDSFFITQGTQLTSEMLPKLTTIGRIFDGWYINGNKIEGNDYIINSNTTLYAQWFPGKPTYTVKHYKETLDGSNFILVDEEILEGNSGSNTQANPKDYYGFYFAPINQEIINTSNSTVINIYYYRKNYTITINLDGGISQNNETGIITISGKYETPISFPNPTKDDYIFMGWNITDGFLPNIITKNEEYKALWVDTGNSLVVQLQNDLIINLTSNITNGTLIVTAEQGFNCYSWKIDSKNINGTTEFCTSNSPNILNISDFTIREDGIYIIQVTAIKNGIEYSGLKYIQKKLKEK